MTAVLPPARVAIAGNAPPSREWYRYFQAATQVNLDVGTLRHDVDALTVRVTALEDAPPSSGDIKITGTGSIYVSATAVKVVSLEGDAEDPGFTTYYGTDVTGAKGWYAVSDALASSGNIAKSTDAAGVTSFDLVDLADSGTGALQAVTFDAKGRKTGSRAATITGTAGRITVAHGDASDGLPTIDIATVADAGGGTLQKTAFDAYGRKTGTSAATTTDLTEGANLYFINARADARADVRIAVAKADPDGIASLVGGKLDPGQLPALAITETFVVNTQTAMLALSAQEGDVAVRTDLSKSFILTAAPASTLANWQELLVPTAGVTSFNGRTGSVTPASGDYTPAQVGAEPAIAAGTTAQYRRGDKTWRDFATDVRAAVLTGLSTATSAFIAATDTVLQALGKLQAQITDNLLPPGYIDGLQMQWVSGTAITVTSGAAYIVGGAKVLRATAGIAKTGLSLSASTWYHVYLYDNAGTPDVELSTAAPDAPYNGTARTKTGDAYKRYLGSVKTNSSGAIFNFLHEHQSGSVSFLESTGSGTIFNILANGASASETVVDSSGAVPISARSIIAKFSNTTSTSLAVARTNVPGSSASGPPYGSLFAINPSNEASIPHPLSSDQKISYWFSPNTPSSGGLGIFVYGYNYSR